MTESQIQYFLTVAQERSISKAAEILFVSQPAVSKQLALLENELEVRLFERKNRSLEITEAGITLEKMFLDFKVQFKQTMDTLHSANQILSGTYHLGCVNEWDLMSFYPELNHYLKTKYPQINIEVEGYNFDQIIYALRKGEADAVIATKSVFENYPEIVMHHLTEANAMIVFSTQNPLAQKEDLKISDFKDSEFLVTTPQKMPGALNTLVSFCKANGFSPKVEYTPTLSGAYMKMQTGRGVFFTNDWIMAKDNPRFRKFLLGFKRNIGIATMVSRKSQMIDLVTREIISFFEQRNNKSGENFVEQDEKEMPDIEHR